ncbi:sensor histidine kinase [Cohnella suwonensis]|uniref:Oxygen sensor histidine kinase NreB n=1 Tax=Cohnella suwonensis TaxID=696072 RepID=A0ABW0M083_9BACL
MNDLQEPPTQPMQSNRRRNTRWLFALYSGTIAVNLFLTVCYIASLPFYYRYLKDSCFGSTDGCANMTISVMPASWNELFGFTASGFAWFYIALDLFFYFCYVFVAALILLLKPKDVLGFITAFTLINFAFGNQINMQWEGSSLLVPLAQNASLVGFMCFALWFPSGRMTRDWLPWVAGAAFLARSVPYYLPYPEIQIERWPLWLSLCWVMLFYGTLSYSQFTQYRENATSEARHAIGKVAYGFIGAFLALISVSLLLLVWPEYYMADVFWLDLTVRIIMLLIPFSLGSALLKHQLWGVPPVVRRSFVYVALLAVVFGIYMATVWYLSLVFRTESGVFPLLATGLVAVLFSPIKEGLDKLVNRLVYGKREDPVSLLIGLGDRLREPFNSEQVLQAVVSTVKETMQLPYASITLFLQGRELDAAISGVPRDSQAVRFPLVMGGEELGSLYASPRAPDEPFTEADYRLLQLLSRESARVVHGLKQSLDIGQLMQELQASREQLIFAREEERRSIRNNLHDDLAPRLASLALRASAAGDFMRKDPPRAVRIITELEEDILDTVRGIREFVHDLRPPALDQYGLAEAIRQRADQLMQLHSEHGDAPAGHIRMKVDLADSLPPLPAAVEVAVYRIVTESLVNIVKHSQADECRVTLAVRMGRGKEELFVEIRDNGIGIPRTDMQGLEDNRGAGAGVGLASIKQRAAELGGRCLIEPVKGSGTRITAWLPLQLNPDWSVGHHENINR